MDRSKLTTQDIAALAKSARLDLSEERIAVQTEVMPGIFQMLDALDEVPVGETAPAFAYRAKWSNQP